MPIKRKKRRSTRTTKRYSIYKKTTPTILLENDSGFKPVEKVKQEMINKPEKIEKSKKDCKTCNWADYDISLCCYNVHHPFMTPQPKSWSGVPVAIALKNCPGYEIRGSIKA